jgi:hypothetical protein
MGIHQQQTGSGAGKDRAPVAADLRSPALQQALKVCSSFCLRVSWVVATLIVADHF